MANNMATVVRDVVGTYKKDATRLLDIVRDVQKQLGCVTDETIGQIAKEMNISRVDVDGVVTFYHFFSKKPVGKTTVYLNNSITSQMNGYAAVAKAFEEAAGCKMGTVTADGQIGLFHTSCIGMNDQEPAAIINDVIFTKLTADKAKEIITSIKANKPVQDLVKQYGDGQNQNELIKAMVNSHIQKSGSVILADFDSGSAIKKTVAVSPDDVIKEIRESNLRGRGGAGFPTGMKWDFCRKSQAAKHYVVCNADEGEPGTFKDRVIITEKPQLLFEGMAIAGYAVGAEEGILYLRAEYMYLKNYLEKILDDLRKKNILGKNAGGKSGFNFDIRIQMGAGAYICGEESALIESAEGKRGEPRNRPPYPVTKGFMDQPTTVNNVETYCAVARIMTQGAAWFKAIGTEKSAGTRLLSISGDCKKPGIYEMEFGTSMQKILEMCEGTGAKAIQIGGPSGTLINSSEFNRILGHEDLATGGSFIVFGPSRDILHVVHNFMEFFVEESCGFCTPCRAGNVLLLHKLNKILDGNGTASDLKEMEEWSKIIKTMSRCGLGQTSPNPVVWSLKNFRELYEAKINKGAEYLTGFNLAAAVEASCKAANRKPNLHHEE
jgi:[NiFe] hydrogenase diaphorase moiety large subunit